MLRLPQLLMVFPLRRRKVTRGINTAVVLSCHLLAAIGTLFGMVHGAEAVTAVHKNCPNCHTGLNAPGMPPLKAGVVELCLSCHPANTRDHLLGAVPGTPPAGLPLDKERKMTCITCHEPHGKGTATKLLRMKSNDLCQACHQK